MINKFSFCKQKWHHTTLLAIKTKNHTLLAADGQVSLGPTIVKSNAIKIRSIQKNIHVGFAGSVSDAFYLLNTLEPILLRQEDLLKACIDFSMLWRTGKIYRQLEASLLVVGRNTIVELDGTGNVMEIDRARGVGSGGLYAECSAEALLDMENSGLSGEEIVKRAMGIAAKKCVYTSDTFVIKQIENY